MSRDIYALLVGVDDYPAPVPPLRGCVNDVRAAATLLAARAGAAGDRLHVRVLADHEATRADVIAAFRDHLGQARDGDSAVFWFAGHGAQEPALPEHLDLEPDRLNETLVLVDSRQPGVYDLADKELAQLVAEVADRGPHVLVVLDCCHSGSGVRAVLDSGEAVRRAPADERNRPRESYLALTAQVAAAAPGERADWLNLTPASRYVLLAACRSDQTAKEVRVERSARGALSVALERALARAAGPVSYRELHAWTAATVRTLADDQTPVLEAPRTADITQPFLGGAASPISPVLTASHRPGRGWVLDAGLVHGIPAPVAVAAPTELTLHGLPGAGDAGPVVARARVVAVTAASATLDVEASTGSLDPTSTYRAVVRSLPVPRVRVAVTGDDGAAVRAALAASALVEPVAPDEVDAGGLVATCVAGRARITRGRGDRALVADQSLTTPEGAESAALAVERIARWQAVRDRENPASRLPAAAVDLAVFDADGAPLPVGAGGVERAYTVDANGVPVQPVVRVRVRNGSPQRLYYAALALSELFGVASLIPGGGVWLDPGEEVWLPGDDGRPRLYLSVPPGQERTTDVLKLVVGTEEFDARQLAQDDLLPPTPTRGPDLTGDRGIGGSPELPVAVDDWTTRELLLTTVRPQPGAALSPVAPRPIAPGVVVRPHPQLRATARLVTRPAATRGAVVPLLPPLLADQPEVGEPFVFSGTRSAGEELSILQLEDVEAADTVTAQQPLVVVVDQPLGPGEHVLAVASDGEDHLPLGVGRPTADGRVELRLTRLPQPTPAGTRSLGGSLKLLFRKLVLRPLGVRDAYPLLSLVRYDADGAPHAVTDPPAVRAAVTGAERVLLLVHGIIGDTRGMTRAIGAGPEPLSAGYDAVLTFDYENLHTGIDEIAGLLRDRLADAGLGAGTRIDVVAHSMGGLVARWYVELGGAAARVDRLVTCGTPHLGSPWPRVEDLAVTALAFGLNRVADLSGLPGTVAAALAFLVQGVERVDVTLDQMTPGSTLLAALAGTGEPDVPYVVIAGDQPFGSAAEPGRVARLLQKLRVPGAVLDALFDGRPHDIAVSVESATAVGRGWRRPPQVIDAACSHLTYFSSPEGAAALRRALS